MFGFRDCGFYSDVNENFAEKKENNKIKAFENAINSLPKEVGHDPIDDLPKEVNSNVIKAFENAKKVKR